MSLRDEAFAVRTLLSALADELREDRDELNEEIADSAIESETSLKEAIERTLRASAEDEAHIAAIKAMVATLEARASRKATRIERRKGAIMAAFEIAQVPGNKLELASVTVSVGKGRRKVIITDEALIPPQYMIEKVTRSPDKSAIASYLADNVQIPGAELSNAMPTLTVRAK